MFDWFGVSDINTKEAPKKTYVRSSSRKVYKEIKKEGTIGAQSRLILDSMLPECGYSLQEICRVTGITINAVSGRVNSLKKEGYLIELPKRKCMISGRTIIPVSKPRK
jgi:biotin operon repressor